jgi:hypothetical protein
MGAFADPENVASCRVLEKAGFKKGKLFENMYTRAVHKESRKRSNLQYFWVAGPNATDYWVNEKSPDTADLQEEGAVDNAREFTTDNEESHDLLRDSIKSMLMAGGTERQPSIRVLNRI